MWDIMKRCRLRELLAAQMLRGENCGYPNTLMIGYASGAVEIYEIVNIASSQPICAVLGSGEENVT